jgi:hypothetical protein
MKRAVIVALFCVAAGLGMSAWHYRTITIAYRLTLEVRVDGETHFGTGIVATDWARSANPLAQSQFIHHDRGEAVTVDLGRYGPLFLVLLGKHDVWGLPMVVYGESYEQSMQFWNYLLDLSQPKPAREIPHDALPLLVRFRDIAQPSTAECIDPDNMAASFPPGAHATLVHATIEIVDESATLGTVEKWLPWLGLPRQELGRLLTGPVWRFLPNPGKKLAYYFRYFWSLHNDYLFWPHAWHPFYGCLEPV